MELFARRIGCGNLSLRHLPFRSHGEGDEEWFVNADNIYMEWLVEGGVWLLPLFIAACFVFTSALLKLARVQHAPHISALVLAGWFLLTSQVVSQTFDFGWLIPANSITIALLAGAVIGCADQISRTGDRLTSRSHKQRPDKRSGKRSAAQSTNTRIPAVALACTCLMVVGTLGLAGRHARAAAATDYVVRADAFTQSAFLHSRIAGLGKANTDALIEMLPAATSDPDARLKRPNCCCDKIVTASSTHCRDSVRRPKKRGSFSPARIFASPTLRTAVRTKRPPPKS